MKSFLEKSKRALVLLLTGAMIATSVPSTAFAATLGTDADDVIIEEVTDAVAKDAVVEEEIVVAEPSDAVEALGAEEEPVDEEVDSVDAENAITRIISIDFVSADPANATTPWNTLNSYKYGEGNYSVTATAKEGLAGSTTTFKNAKVELYKVDVDNWQINDRGDVAATHGAAVAAVTGDFNTYIGAQRTYVNDETTANKATWENAKAPITRNTSKMTNIPVSNTEFPTGLSYTINEGVLTFTVDNTVKSAYNGYYVIKVYDADGNPEAYTPLFNIKALGAFNAPTTPGSVKLPSL